MARKTRIIDQRGRRRLTRNEKVGVASIATLLAVAAVFGAARAFLAPASQAFLPIAHGLICRSMKLLSIGTAPSSRCRVNAVQLFRL